MNVPLPRQVIPVRYRHFETPTSYLRRLCVANSIDTEWMARQVAQRRMGHKDGGRAQGDIIAELGGPAPFHIERAWARASVGIIEPRGPWARPSDPRTACLSCTAGERIDTYRHIRFAFCRRHGQWLGQTQRNQVMDETLWKAERRLRRLVTRGRINSTLYDAAWGLVRDNAYMTVGKNWSPRLLAAWNSSDFVRETDDRIALFGETVRVLDVASQREYVQRAACGRLGRDANRDALYNAFAWAGPDRWILVEGIVKLLETESRHAAA